MLTRPRPDELAPEAPGAARRPGRARLAQALYFLLPAALAVGLCLFEITARSIWLDESATLTIASQHGEALWAAMAHDGGNMLVYYALIHVLIMWFGKSVLVLRLPSAFATALMAGSVAVIGRRLFDRRVGLAAGLLAAVSLPIVYWGQDARAYAFMFAFGATSYLGFIALVDGESRRPGKPPRWAAPLYVASLVLAAYMSFIALLVVPAQLLALGWNRRRLRPVVGSLVATALLCLPLLPIATHRGAGQLFWVPRPGLGVVGGVFEALASSALSPNFKLTASSLPLLGLTVLVLLAAARQALSWARSHPAPPAGSRERFVAALLVAWLLVPTVLDFAESWLGQPIFESRYLLISAPALALLLAWGLLSFDYAKVGSRRLAGAGRFGGVAAVGLFVVLRGLQILPSYATSPENWRAATRYVLERADPGDCVAFYPSDGRMAFDYYLEEGDGPVNAVPRPVLPSLPFGTVKPFVEVYATLTPVRVAALTKSCPRLWLVSSHIGMPTDSPRSAVHYDRYQHLLQLLGLAYPQQIWAHIGYASRINVGLFGPHLASQSSLDSYLSGPGAQHR